MDSGAYRRLELTLPPIEVTIASRKAYVPGEVVPEGRNETSPVRSVGLAFRKTDPSPMGRSTGVHAREPGSDRPGAEHFDRPWRDRHLDLLHFPVRQLPDAELLSLSPFGATSAHRPLREPTARMRNEQPRSTHVSSCFLYRPTSLGYMSY
jgi:hypothetical protein